jgi:hypothetical protein
MRRKNVPSTEYCKSKDPEAGQDLVCVVSIMKVNMTETDMLRQRRGRKRLMRAPQKPEGLA